MDSPLLPTFKRNPDVSESPSAFMSNMSLEPSSPSDSFAISQHASSSSRAPYSSSSSSQSQQDTFEAGEEAIPPRRPAPRFSLFAPGSSARHDDEDVIEQEGQGEGEADADETPHTSAPPVDPSARDDKLRESLYELRQMNEVFEGFLTALEAARGHNERLALRVKETTSLLDTYTAILVQQDHTQALLLNPNWHGAAEEQRVIEREEEEKLAAEQAVWEAAERARFQEEERQAEEDRQRTLRESAAQAKEAASSRGGTARGRGGTRGLSRGSGIPSRTTGTTGIRKPSAGLGGQYANVKSSGYGPAPKKAT